MVEQRAGLGGFVGISRFTSLLDFANDALAIDHERHALRNPYQRIQDTVFLGDNLAFIAEYGKAKVEFGSKGLVALRWVYADANHLRAGLLKFGDISLIRHEFLPSPWRKGTDVEGQHHTLLTPEVTEAYRIAVLIAQRKVRGWLSYSRRTACCR